MSHPTSKYLTEECNVLTFIVFIDIFQLISTIFFVHITPTSSPFMLMFYIPLASFFFLCWFGNYIFIIFWIIIHLCIWQREYNSLLAFIESKEKKSKTRQKSEESIKERTRDSDDILWSRGAELNSSKEENECFPSSHSSFSYHILKENLGSYYF